MVHMRQRDKCGCGTGDTPTLAQLLASARARRVPIIGRHSQKPANLDAAMKGRVRWALVDRAGREAQSGEGPNLILDQGLDQIATVALVNQLGDAGIPAGYTYFPLIRYCAVGTDSTAPAASDTALGTEVARSDTAYQTEEINRTASGVYELTRYVEFDYADANGNLTEWGFSYNASGPGNLFNHALFLDGGGSPEVVTKTSAYKLRIIYTLEITLTPVALTSGSFALTGVGTVNGDYMLVGGSAPPGVIVHNDMHCTAPDIKLFSALARGDLGSLSGVSAVATSGKAFTWGADLSGMTYAYSTVFSLSSANPYAADATDTARDAYTPGSFTRTGGLWKWGTAYGNRAPVKAMGIVGAYESYQSGTKSCGPLAGYVFDLDLADEYVKDNEHTLTIGVPTVTWGRAP